MKNSKKVVLFLLIIGCFFLIGGVTYAFFTYNKVGSNQKIIAGEISMSFTDDNDCINLTGIFPETVEEARNRDDNYVTFTISGTNTSNKTIYYEIDLIHGNDETGLTRFNDKDLRFDLVEVVDSEDIIINENVSFNEINNSKIWVDSIEDSSDDYNKTYKIRMWLDENVLISDTNPDATYSASTYKNHYASVRVKVVGDFDDGRMPHYFFEYASYLDNFDFTTLPSYTDNYQTLNRSTFIKIEGSQKSLCIIKDNKLECFKNTNYENEKAHLQSIFEESECEGSTFYDGTNNYSCENDDWMCYVRLSNDNPFEARCVSYETLDVCTVSSGRYGCEYAGWLAT